MTRPQHRKLLVFAQLVTLAPLGALLCLNLLGWLAGWAMSPWLILAGLPGLAGWVILDQLPKRAQERDVAATHAAYRLVYDAPAGWDDEKARRALENLAASGAELTLVWAREGEGVGCWLAVKSGHEAVLQRLVEATFPAGQLESDPLPQPEPAEPGVVILAWPAAPPPPARLCRLAGVQGVYYRRYSDSSATVAVWGEQAAQIMQEQCGVSGEALLAAAGPALRRSFWRGDNPWPQLPPFPASAGNPGLAATSDLRRLAPGLRVAGPALVLGRDAAGAPVGFELERLAELKRIQVVGHSAGRALETLAGQALQAGLPLLLLDGRGVVVGGLKQRFARRVAREALRVCDLAQPAQSALRLNPLWLPAEPETWPPIFDAWQQWLRALGVTAAGLGPAAYRHTVVAVTLTALAAAGRGLALDPPALQAALAEPKFLSLLDETTLPTGPLLGDDWRWWLAEGRQIPNFDLRLRLNYLRHRLRTLLALPEYEVLWRAPYLSLGPALAGGQSLLWRLPDPRRRLRPYVTSLLLAMTSLLQAGRPPERLVVLLHEIEPGPWRPYLQPPGVCLIEGYERLPDAPTRPDSLIVSRLHRADAEVMAAGFNNGIRAADLRRLPDDRLLLWRHHQIGTVELAE